MHLWCPVTENRHLCDLPVLLLQRHPCLTSSMDNHSILIQSHGRDEYIKVDTETCARRLKSNNKESLAHILFLLWTLHTVCICLKQTFASVHKFLWILSDQLWQPHTVEEAWEDKHWFQTNLPRHPLFLVQYTFPQLMSSHLYSLLSKMFYFMPCVRNHWRYVTREERWRREHKKKSLW